MMLVIKILKSRFSILMYLLFATLLISNICEGQNGIISGNAFWKYNDFVGNKPDAASDVYVYSKDIAREVLHNQCDVQGNYRFENMEPGKYLIVVISKNTTARGDYNFIQYKYPFIKDYLLFDIAELNKQIYDSLAIFDTLYAHSDTLYYQALREPIKVFAIKKWEKNIDEKKKNLEKIEHDYYEAIQRLLALIPLNRQTIPLMTASILSKKMDFREIIIKPNETTTVITDFGITYN